jgi:hypothetical protein
MLAPGGDDPASPVPAPPPATCRVAPSPNWAGYSEDPADVDLSPFQDYRAAMGIGDGIRGSGVTIADVEYEWRPTHVELAAIGLAAPPATGLPAAYRSADHGTAVLGVLGASPDGKGVSGLVPDADLRPISPFYGRDYQPARAINDAAAGLGPGDVILIEQQAQAGGSLVPVEFLVDVRNAIAAAVRKGIVVVEPAGNGNLDIGTLEQAPWLAGQTAPGHSGAIIVGAGGSDTDQSGPTALRRAVGSNWGSRVDLQGIGVGVVTSGYGDGIGGVGDRAYTSCFDGTSSASATVAAAVAALQSGAIAQNGQPLAPADVRRLLVETGQRQVNPEDGVIGPRPRVDAALIRLAGGPPPADLDVPVATVTAPQAPAVPVRPGRIQKATAPAATVTARYAKAGGRLTIRLARLAKGAKVTAAGRRAKVVRGTVVLRRVKPGRFVVVVTPPAALRTRYATVRVVVVIAKTGAVRVVTR